MSFAFNSIRGKLTFAFVVLFSVLLVLLSTIAYNVHTHLEEKDFDTNFLASGVHYASLVRALSDSPKGLPQILYSANSAIGQSPQSAAFLQVRKDNGEIIAHSDTLDTGNIALSEEDLIALKSETGTGYQLRSFTKTTKELDVPYRVLNMLVKRPQQSSLILQVAFPISYIQHARAEIVTYTLFAFPICLLVVAIWGLFFSSRLLAPIQSIIRTADHIEVGNLRDRIPVPERDREMKDLVITLNRLLARVEQAVKANDSFVANASHQLKTPIAILRGEVDILLRKNSPLNHEDFRLFLQSAQQELQGLSEMMEDLLLLARVDSGQASIEMSLLRLDEVAIEVVSKLDSLARKKNIALRLNLEEGVEEFETLGDQELIATMISNLVVNAINYSPSGTLVNLRISRQSDRLILRIEDQGPGISPNKEARLFERFYRDPLSQRKAKGSGLGLPIVKTIVEAHRGQVKYETATTGGARFIISLPTTTLK